MSETAELVVGSLVAGKYRIEHLLGRGGMGAVYLATNEDIGRRVAIKVLLEEYAREDQLLKRFRQEARTAAAIGHPGIVDVLDLGTTEDGAPFIVMEALEGETLGARIARLRRLSIEDTVHLVLQTLDALAAAHDVGVLHRDLKPDNLFVVTKPVPGVKILDFGISKLAGSEDVALTQTGAVIGTALYMSPEQARGSKTTGPASDVYAIGSILFQALTGRTPFIGETYNEVLEKLFTQPAPPVTQLRSDTPPALAALIEQMLAKDPDRRLASARAAYNALLAISETIPRAEPEHAKTQPRDLEVLAPTQQRPSIDPRRPSAPLPAGAEPRPSMRRLAVAETKPATIAPAASDVALPAAPAASNLALPATVRARKRWLVGGGAIVLAGGIVTLALTRRERDPVVVPVPADAARAADARPLDAAPPVIVPPPAPVLLTLVAATPVHWIGRGVDCVDGTRCEVKGAPGAHTVLTATATGYKVADVSLSFDFDRVIEIKLDAIPVVHLHDAGVALPDVLDIDRHNPLKP